LRKNSAVAAPVEERHGGGDDSIIRKEDTDDWLADNDCLRKKMIADLVSLTVASSKRLDPDNKVNDN
jgi:hypothetical protein